MPNSSFEAPRPRVASRDLGPYETAYDVRRGYDRPDPAEARPALRADPEEVWMGRRRER